MAVNVYIVITLVVSIILAIVFAGLFAWEYTQQTEILIDLRTPEWRHVNHKFDYAEEGEEEVLLTCPADKNIMVTNAVLQYYDPLDGEDSWNAHTGSGGIDAHRDSYWVSYGNVQNYPDNLNNDPIGQCDFKQTIPGQLNQQCNFGAGNCTVRVNKNGSVSWEEEIPGETAVCTSDAKCMTNGDGGTSTCKFSLQVSYICDSKSSIDQAVSDNKNIKTSNEINEE
jgi:hypothetical protein